MIAKFPGKCFICGEPITSGVDIYDFEKKRSHHQDCIENELSDDAQSALAERLGFVRLEESDDGAPGSGL